MDGADQGTSTLAERAGPSCGPYRCVVLRTLRQPRYAALAVVMAIVAIGCVAAGTWQISRFQQKVHENDALRANAHQPTAPLDGVLPLLGAGRAPSDDDVEFRTVTATGTYDAAEQSLVRNRSVSDDVGYLVLTPLHTAQGTLLVVRGFVPLPASGGTPSPPPPPAGTVTITARTHAPETRDDAAAQLTQRQVESINPAQQASRLGGAVYDGYAELEAHQPGTDGLVAIPKPDLSNPAGGALEPQHFAYVIQWYLFALLALAAPFVMARAEMKQRPVEEIDAVPPPEPTVDPSAGDLRAAKLADRYGHAR
jgi:cytochrome oxidase assembly protein ShyY1